MSGIANQLATASANTEYLAYASELFDRPIDGPFSLYTQILPCDGRALELDSIGPSGEAEEFLGTRAWTSLREYAKRTEVKPYSLKGLSLRRDRVDLDKTGAMAQRLRDYLSGASNFWDAPVTSAFLANPTGIDGVSLLSTSHPHAFGGGTWSNKVTTAFSQAAIDTGWAAMSALRNEAGAPFNIKPTHLMVGPSLYASAVAIAGVRPVGVGTAGTIVTSGAVAAVPGPSYLNLEVVLNTRMIGDNASDWFLMDLSKPGVRPMVAGEAIKPEAKIQLEGEGLAQFSQYRYWVEAYGALGGGVPHVIYGRLGA